jgi:uncharacterized membrane protein YcjF (UPF0283 family)
MKNDSKVIKIDLEEVEIENNKKLYNPKTKVEYPKKKRKWEYVKDMLGFLGVLWGLGFSILIYFTFLLAYIVPSKMVLVSINSFNEALFEFYLIPVVLAVILWGVYWYWHEAFEDD